jgi:hypothetical protein
MSLQNTLSAERLVNKEVAEAEGTETV